jgi:hypothetical protein
MLFLAKTKVGAKKLADVLQLMEPVIAQGLADAGLSNKQQDVINYINSVVTILNTMPAPVITYKTTNSSNRTEYLINATSNTSKGKFW